MKRRKKYKIQWRGLKSDLLFHCKVSGVRSQFYAWPLLWSPCPVSSSNQLESVLGLNE